MKLTKKAMEMKVLVSWLLIIIGSILLLILIGVFGGESFAIVDAISDFF